MADDLLYSGSPFFPIEGGGEFVFDYPLYIFTGPPVDPTNPGLIVLGRPPSLPVFTDGEGALEFRSRHQPNDWKITRLPHAHACLNMLRYAKSSGAVAVMFDPIKKGMSSVAYSVDDMLAIVASQLQPPGSPPA